MHFKKAHHTCERLPSLKFHISLAMVLQGRDDIGRPLLERALAIQEKHLGPDHPDVVAIRDVLNEE